MVDFGDEGRIAAQGVDSRFASYAERRPGVQLKGLTIGEALEAHRVSVQSREE
jgi:hypothetical protein